MPQQQAVPAWCQLAIAHLEPSAPGAEGQQTCHRMRRAIEIVQLLAQQQHAAAFGIHRALLRKLPQGGKASAALPQLLSVLLRKTAWQDQSPGVGRNRFIGEGAPGQQGHRHALQLLACLGVAEVKSLIHCDGHRQRRPGDRSDLIQRRRP